MTSMSPDLADVLRRIAEADTAAGGNVRFTPSFGYPADGPIRVTPHIDGCQALVAGRMDALHERKLLEVEPTPADSKKYGQFRITAAGHDANARYRDPTVPSARSTRGMDASWPRAQRVLEAVVEQWEQHGARAAVGTDAVVAALVDELDADAVHGALELLEQDGYVDAEFEGGTDWPIAVTPKPKALQRLRGWPTETRDDTALVRALLEALDDAIANTSDLEEKHLLRKLRDVAGHVGKDVLAGAIVAAAAAIAGG